MAFNLFKWFTTGNGDDDAPAPKPSPKASTPAPSSRSGSGTTPKTPTPAREPDLWERFLRGSSAGTPMPKFSIGYEGTPNPTPGAKVEPVKPAPTKKTEFSGDYTTLDTNVPLDVLRDPNAVKHVGGTYGATRWTDLEEIPQYVPGQTNKRDSPVTQNKNATPDYRRNDEVLAADSRDAWTSGLGTNSLTDIKELTWDEYDALTPRQRAAVDANTALLSAVRQDTEANLRSDKQADSDYLSGVEALFGKEGGSDIYAPNTLKALQDLGISNIETGDLDQYLSGGALLNFDDLKSLEPGPIPVENGMNVAGDTSPRVQNALALGDKALSSLAARLQSGGAGYDAADAADIDQFLDSLALRSNQQLFQENPAQVGQLVGLFLDEHPNLTPESFARYFEDRINRYDYNVALGLPASLGSGSADLYINPSELRSLVFSKGGQ